MAEDKKEGALKDTGSKAWIWIAALSALFYAVGNAFYGTKCSLEGVGGVGYLGPAGTVTMLIAKLVDMVKVS